MKEENGYEEKAVGGYSKIEDAFVGRYLTKDGETVADAKERLKKEQEKREAEKAESTKNTLPTDTGKM